MSDYMIFQILQEHEPDFSAEICEDISIEDLDVEAIRILKQKYALKQKNPDFLTLPDEQVLSDLLLVKDNKVTNAALILVGKQEVLNAKLPQAAIFLEFRKSEALVPFTYR